ncbi:hypothetical protein BDV96DRAFT_485510 [Lophiotrema nucula]|uniref:Uncharacterized protein n=1 Tax=Lophiotrema nucula TaxID=690887 RepID=A0A6A5ZKS2_9PLEO|nr:hypothetical protein BDV96DRAFT_485510 [Lophiotrema nucula]
MSEEIEPSEFVRRIRDLGAQRDQQDAERVRKLEEEVLKGREERMARRAERARSLSPDKPTTPQSLPSAADTPRNVQEKAADTPTPTMDPPSQQSARDDSLQRLTGSPAQVLEDDEPKKPAPSAAALGRSGTLSWQRRPQSGSVRRPLSATSGTDRKSTSSPHQTPEPEPSSPAESSQSRAQIAQSLGAKDPSWFRQTPDRGVGSAAYRRNQDDAASETGSISGRRQLPRMSRDSTAEPEATSPPPESFRSSSPSHVGSIRGSAAFSNRFSTNTSVSGGDAEPVGKGKSPLPVLDSQKFAPPLEERSSVDSGNQSPPLRTMAMSPTQGRISPERPASPTKGMGGFVQSAMLKRSDSVNKRWSAQAPQSLSRQNSTVSNRGSAALGTYGSISKGEPRPSSLSRDNSMEPSSRPGSSSSNLTITKDAAAEKDSTPKAEFAKPALPHHSRSKSVASTFSEDTRPQEQTSPPSPSKRWSPTKSSWLESALNKPDSPKPKQPPPQQPTWMTEINRIKQQRGSVDLGKGGSLIQSPPAEGPASGRTSPIKDVQLKPVALRSMDTPKKEEAVEPVRPSPKPKPAVTSPKPSVAVKEERPSLEDLIPEPVDEKVEVPKEELPELKPKPASLSSRLSKDSPLASPTAKPKPDTPPKKDFRAGLRSRQGTTDSSKKEEASELQNVFGRLKKTETKNYVAPDTLKDNILRGKSGLAVTGGPKPSVRRDEFKESLISKKTAMLAKAQEHGSTAHKRTDSGSQQTSTPEAIAKRKLLGRSDSISKDVPLKEAPAPPEALARQQSLRSSKPALSEKPAPSSSAFAPKEPVKTSKLADRFNPALAGILARGPPMSASPPASAEDYLNGSAPRQPIEEERKGPAPELNHMTKGRARGPKRRAPASKQASTETKEASPSKAPIAAVPLVKTADVLFSTEVARANNSSEEQSIAKTPARDSLEAKPSAPTKSLDLSKRLSKSPSSELAQKPEPLVIEKTPAKPVSVPKPSPKADVSSPSSSPRVASWRSSRPLPTPPVKPELQKERSAALKEIAPPNAEVSPTRKDPSPDKPSFSVKSATALWGQSSSSSPAPAQRVRSPIKLPTRADEKAALEDAGIARSEEAPAIQEQPKPLAPKPKPVGLGLGSVAGFFGARSRESSPVPPAKPVSVRALPVSPPASGDRPQSEPFKASPMPEKSDGMFAEFFAEPPVTSGALPDNIDTVQVLKNPPYEPNSTNKIRTLRKQIQEVTGDGKLINVPVQEEHVLFQDSMYICTHIYGDLKGAKFTDVYLWSGNGVAEATLEDAQLFGRNVAKQNQGKLIILRQGNETPNFFEALGGIVITRRGSKPAGKDYMLCGRRHLGHLVFDEVDFSLKSFCSGFAYLISTSGGKVYLWKGRGCSSEELSGARLMGMDLTLTGELVEVDEGTESQDLINIFPPHVGKGPAIPRSADHWRYKAGSDKYRTRLFKIEQQEGGRGWGQSLQVSSFFSGMLRRPSWNATTDRPQTPTTPKSPLPQVTTKVVEVMPYCQRDLEPEHIFVLDAFFEMYIVVGALSRSQSAAFSAALMFAQEYSILAVSEEDRPFMPVTTVVLEGVPRDMKSVFRFWDDALIPAAGLMRGKLGRGKSLRIVGLEKAIEATRI